MTTKYTPPILIYMNRHPTRFAAIVLVAVLVPVWWLAGVLP